MSIWGLVSIAIFGIFADGTPTITFPLNSQLPPIARVSEPFSYTFSESTFFSTLPVTYVLSWGPTWLSLESSSRTISGTPPKKDFEAETVTGIPIGITAIDSSGSISLNSTLVVSKNPAPTVKISASNQLPSFGVFSSPATLLYHPSSPFKFEFDPGTFSSSGLSYYAVTTDDTPLPSWVTFDGSKLSFSGQTPGYASLIQPPQIFGIRLIASDVEGFAGTSIFFEIEVGVHLLAIVSNDLVINATKGAKVKYEGLVDAIQIDGSVATTLEIVSVTANTPQWLDFDNTTLTFSGTVPEDAVPYNVTVGMTDIYEDTANVTILIDVPAAIFSKEIGDFNVTIGSTFKHDLSRYLYDPSDVEMTVEISNKESWISFEPKTFLLSGDVPSTAKPSEVRVDLKATSKSSESSSSQSFKLSVSKGIDKPSSSATKTASKIATTSAQSATGNLIATSVHSINGLSTSAIIAITVPLSLLFIAVVLALSCYIYRRRSARSRPGSPSKSDTSTPQEAPSSVVEITDSTRLGIHFPPPEPLELDMSGFGRPTSSVMFSTEGPAYPKRKSQQMLRRSHTVSAMSDPRLSRILRESDASGNRMRSRSDNVLTRTESRWSSTQERAYPTLRSSRTNPSHRLTPTYSNCLMKGHVRRSARVLSSNSIKTLRESTEPGQTVEQPTQSIQQPQPGDSILNLQNGNFSITPIDKFSALSTQGSTKYTADDVSTVERPSRAKSTRRHSRFMPGFGAAATGVGHGGRESISPFPGEGGKRGSVEHGQDWVAAKGLARDSRTVGTAEGSERQNRHSNTSNYSVHTETPVATAAPNARMSFRMISKSSSINSPPPTKSLSSRVSNSSMNSRPVSRRIGSSPFFGGSSIRTSRKSSKRMRTSYADSPTVPEEAIMPGLEETILRGMREMGDQPQRDSFEISYGLAREGTRQLRSFVQNQLHRSRTCGSVKSIESKDSRFESATNSMHSLLQPPQNPHNTPQAAQGNDCEDYLAEDTYSENSWETTRTTRDSRGNIIEYAPEDLPEVTMAAAAQARARASLIASSGGGGLSENPVMLDREVHLGPDSRIVMGAVRRPISVGAGAQRKRSSRVLVEGGDRGTGGDYTAYI